MSVSIATPSARHPLRLRSDGRLRFLRFRGAQVGLAITLFVIALALLGPLFAPHLPTTIVGRPFSPPTSAHLLGTDFLGRDGLSRVLYGGRSLLGLSLLATLVAYAIGLPAGLLAGYSRSLIDPIVMRTVDVLLAVPPLLFLLVVATGSDSSVAATVVATGIISAPGLTRIIRSAVLDVSVRSYVEAAIARGERTSAILRREILPNILGVVMADAGLRFTTCILLIASLNFLGLGLQPPHADWALMIAENRTGLALQPWVVAVPAVLIAGIAIGVNLVSDAIARSLGASLETITGESGGR
jgi:peptide/nickel transport system permease protein